MDYKEAVENLAKAKSDFLFGNSSPYHAAIVLGTMLKYSENEFRLYDDNLNGDIADEADGFFYKNLEDFVYSGKTLKIVVDNIQNRENRIFTTLNKYRENFPNRVFISTSTPKFTNTINSVYKKNINFGISDDRSFRIEDVTDIIERKAICNFNSRERAKKLIDAFDAEFDNCPQA